MSGLSCSFLAIFSSKYCLGVVGASGLAVSRLVGATAWSFIQRRRSLAAPSRGVNRRSVDRFARVIVDAAVVRGLIVGARSDSALPGMIGNDDRCLPDVVLVIRLGELVAHPGMQRIRIAARFALGGNESGIHRD